mmetsp:Transcript_22680/g.51835  ORF Transcript_22680/g.51835 Transcript_22680/m.51835 type:complete len:300 (-) Transcript_22680:585-1484(-)
MMPARAAVIAPKSMKHPGKVNAFDKGKNDVATSADIIRFTNTAALIARPRYCNGKTSEASNQQTGPMPKEKAATNSITATDAANAQSMYKDTANNAWQSAMDTLLYKSKGRRPASSRRKAAMEMNTVLTTPMVSVSKNCVWVDLAPAFSNTRGLNCTKLSLPLACCANAMPMPTNNIRRVGPGVLNALKRSCQPHSCVVSSTCACSSSRTGRKSVPGACVRLRTCSASAWRDFIMSHRGDSGITHKERKSKTTGKTKPTANMTRQATFLPKPTSIEFDANPSRMPRLIANSDQVVKEPR